LRISGSQDFRIWEFTNVRIQGSENFTFQILKSYKSYKSYKSSNPTNPEILKS